eukprot:TRINITY_DN9706_c0_g2_i1.p1 TRINITY_DN9706_c0_g2~~TRINITY_DN9706_c0_g2_i1.p1  ORF type:complete len:297 (-),score=39.26 TRINITY_DN9706_c0_g2_i1:29-919(-)
MSHLSTGQHMRLTSGGCATQVDSNDMTRVRLDSSRCSAGFAAQVDSDVRLDTSRCSAAGCAAQVDSDGISHVRLDSSRFSAGFAAQVDSDDIPRAQLDTLRCSAAGRAAQVDSDGSASSSSSSGLDCHAALFRQDISDVRLDSSTCSAGFAAQVDSGDIPRVQLDTSRSSAGSVAFLAPEDDDDDRSEGDTGCESHPAGSVPFLALQDDEDDALSERDHKSRMLAAHVEGRCKPCAYIGKRGFCKHGDSCAYCHFCTPEEFMLRRKAAYRRMKEELRANGTWQQRKWQQRQRRIER